MNAEELAASVANHLARVDGIADLYAFLRRRTAKSNVAILMYHRVCPSDEPVLGDPSILMSKEVFETQMQYFSKNYEVLSLDKLIEFIQSRKRPPKKSLVVTFDDGYKDNYLHAYPILRRYNIPATVFLVTGQIGSNEMFWWDKVFYAINQAPIETLLLDDLGRFSLQSQHERSIASNAIVQWLIWQELPRYRKVFLEKLFDLCEVEMRGLGRRLLLSWDEIREMASAGIVFGAHSVSHPRLTNMASQQARDEILQSKNNIEKELRNSVTAFSYPFGDYNTEVLELVRESGFKCALGIWPHKRVCPNDEVYCMNRIWPQDFMSKRHRHLSDLD
ncbi:MAG TPA: polysaccharide deacetylase family protein [Candidatus Bathyarchaeia archaeon]|nr:polysaccharide deacetylase family protein [Candidatus Bathyarchaeia archaeon]